MKHIVFRIVSGLVLIAVITGIALLAYNAGVAHGAGSNIQVPTGQTSGQSYPIYPMPWWPFPFFGFGFFGILALLFLLSMAFGAFRIMLFGPRFGWHMMHRRYGPWGDRSSGEGIPPMFTAIHRRMHAAEEGKSAEQSTQEKE